MVVIIICTTSGFRSVGFPLFHRHLTGNVTAWTTNACEKVVIIPEVMVFLVPARLWVSFEPHSVRTLFDVSDSDSITAEEPGMVLIDFPFDSTLFPLLGERKTWSSTNVPADIISRCGQVVLYFLWVSVQSYNRFRQVCLEYVCQFGIGRFSVVRIHADWNVLKYRLVKIFPFPSHHQVKNEFLEVIVLKEMIKHISRLRGRWTFKHNVSFKCRERSRRCKFISFPFLWCRISF